MTVTKEALIIRVYVVSSWLCIFIQTHFVQPLERGISVEGDIVLVPIVLTGVLPGIPKIGPKIAGHPTIGGVCLLCQKAYVIGDYTTILPLGPGEEQESRILCRNGQPYEGLGVEVHWTCATGEPGVEIIKPR